MVLAGHAGWGPPSVHGVGVEVFFVLSGFLITSLLVEEFGDRGRIDLPRFYLRRARRLLPALFVCLSVVALLAARGELPYDRSSLGLLAGFGYFANIAQMGGDDLGPLTHLWSLSVEEHFYFVWPAVIACTLTIRRSLNAALTVAGVLLVASMVTRWLVLDGSAARVAYGTDTRAAGLLLGCVAAIAVHQRGLPTPRRSQAIALGVAAVAALWWAASLRFHHTAFTWFVVVPVASLGALTLVLLSGSWNAVARCLSMGWLVRLGKISYGVYLWHLPVYFVTGVQWENPLLGRTLVAVAATVAVASVSLRYVEMPIRRRGFLLRR